MANDGGLGRIHGDFITGAKIVLCALEREHIDSSDWYDWFNDPETTKYMRHHRFPNTREHQVQHFENRVMAENSLQLGIRHVARADLIGVVSLDRIDHVNRSAELSIVIGRAENRNVECSLEAMSLIVDHAFQSLNLRRISAGTASEAIARLMCRVLGFRQEGVFREALYKNGEYLDTYHISVLRGEEKSIPSTSSNTEDSSDG